MDMSPIHQVCGQNHLVRHSKRGEKDRQKKGWEDNISEWTGLEFAKWRTEIAMETWQLHTETLEVVLSHLEQRNLSALLCVS